ncbi:aspartate aminotransferase [Rhizopus microsporus var. microsporus]|uniref:aspartate transaminase n=2 Tax=Rhizopus microsporus TaxID=58291 RepID=A0A2G4T3L8_RHIZD|nr:aspartate aminotransferase [Rhizopus microsporus ATCC 52813]ORE04086.1 aspartate aminotransferase [Rhizopus microsporus var. microsporus]PHZ15605.1 aspartate aminotransferase [Rhizopus microsporus ATCC 52813]
MTPFKRLNQITNHLNMSTASVFQEVPQAPPDVIFDLTAKYRADTNPNKVNVGVGAFRTDELKPYVLPVVKKADAILFNDDALDHEYQPIAGQPSFTHAAARLILGADSPAIKENRFAAVQTISGTGANHTGATFLAQFHHKSRKCYISNPTWANHRSIFSLVGFEVEEYPYWHPETRGLDYEGMLQTMRNAPEGSIFVLHACAHNPTGVDPTQEQWKGIAVVMREKGHFPFFDCAYQGFASGDLDKDAWAVRYFVEQGFELFVCQSFAKNFGLYGERCGNLTIVTKSTEEAKRVMSQFERLQRAEISNPPAYGARIVNIVLNDEALFAEWRENLKYMSNRIIEMRNALRHHLEQLQTPGTWNHITDQIGMFSFTGLKAPQVKVLKEKYSIYMTDNGRVSMAGLSSKNVEYFAKAVDDVVRNVPV